MLSSHNLGHNSSLFILAQLSAPYWKSQKCANPRCHPNFISLKRFGCCYHRFSGIQKVGLRRIGRRGHQGHPANIPCAMIRSVLRYFLRWPDKYLRNFFYTGFLSVFLSRPSLRHSSLHPCISVLFTLPSPSFCLSDSIQYPWVVPISWNCPQILCDGVMLSLYMFSLSHSPWRLVSVRNEF